MGSQQRQALPHGAGYGLSARPRLADVRASQSCSKFLTGTGGLNRYPLNTSSCSCRYCMVTSTARSSGFGSPVASIVSGRSYVPSE